jgi:hypothetical protein
MVDVTCGYCGARFAPYGEYENYEGPVPCAGCHKSTWVSVVDGTVVDSKRWSHPPAPG